MNEEQLEARLIDAWIARRVGDMGATEVSREFDTLPTGELHVKVTAYKPVPIDYINMSFEVTTEYKKQDDN
jgi:hypothetical protein